MTKAEFLYHYVKDYFQDEVSFTICSENYKGKDADKDYYDFIKKYKNIFGILGTKSDNAILQGLKECRQAVARGFNEFMINQLMDCIGDVSNRDIIIKHLGSRLNDDQVNLNLMKDIRSLEEQFKGGK